MDHQTSDLRRKLTVSIFFLFERRAHDFLFAEKDQFRKSSRKIPECTPITFRITIDESQYCVSVCFMSLAYVFNVRLFTHQRNLTLRLNS